MSKEDMTRQIIDNNPDFKNDLSDYLDPAIIYSFSNFEEAERKLGLLKLSTVENDALLVNNGFSGVITDKRFTQIVGKESINISFGPELKRTSYFKIPGPYAKETSVEKINCENNEELEIVRLNFVKVIVDENENGKHVTTKVVGHVDSKDFARIGKNHYVTSCKALIDDKSDTDVSNIDKFGNIPTTVIDINTELGIIRCGSYYETEQIVAKTTSNYWICVPIIVKRNMMKDIEDKVEKVFNDNISDISNKIINAEGNQYSEDNLKAIKSFIDDNIKNNPFVNKYNLVYDYEKDILIKLEDVVEENSKELDYLTISDTIFPRYGSENINIEKYEKDECGIPIITNKDIDNIHILNIPKETIQSIIDYSKDSVKTSKEAILGNEEYLEKNKAEIYDAMCNLSLDINEKDWFESCKNNLEHIVNETRSKKEIEDSKNFIDDTCRKIAVFKLISERIQNKIDNGEFSNVFLSLSVEKMNNMSKRMLGEELFNKNKCVFNNWLSIINHFYTDDEFSKSAKDRYCDCVRFSIINYNEKDKFGNYKPTVGESYSRLSSELININDIPKDLSIEEESNELILRVSAKLEFLKALSMQPYDIVSKLYPEISAAVKECDKISEKETETSKYFRTTLGYSNIDTDENKELVSKIVEKIKTLNENLSIEEVDRIVKMASINAEKFINKFNDSKMKGRKSKVENFCKLISIMNNSTYITPIITGKVVSEDRTNLDNKFIISYEDGKEISREVFEGLSDADKERYGVYTEISDKQKKELCTKYVINTMFISRLFSILYKFYNKYSEEFKESEQVNTDSMLTSVLYLLVPSVSIIESLNIESIKEENFDILDLIDTDKKVKLGNTSIKNSMFGIGSKQDVIDTRTAYAEIALKYVLGALDIVD